MCYNSSLFLVYLAPKKWGNEVSIEKLSSVITVKPYHTYHIWTMQRMLKNPILTKGVSTIYGYLQLSTIRGYLLLSQSILNYHGLSYAVLSYLWLSIAVSNYPRLSGTICGYLPLSQAILHYPKLSFAILYHCLGLS